MPKNNNVNFIESKSNTTHPPLYCKICDVRMMFMLTGKVAQKYLCGMCGYTVDPNESSNESEDDEDEDDEFYSKYEDGLRSVDDDNDDVVGRQDNRYESMIVQSNNDSFKQSSIKEESRRPPQMTSQRQQYQQQVNDDWAYQDLKRDIEADGQRRIIEIYDNFTSNNLKVNRITRPR